MDFSQKNTTGDLLQEAASVTVRRTSPINLDARVRGYHSEQIMASANGMTELKTRVDIDSLFSQIDPGIIKRIEIVDGPYTSLYGPGFAFLTADLFATPRYRNGPEMHGSTFLTHGSNGRTLYTRQNLSGGGSDWGLYASYGLRLGNDYSTGDDSEFLVPASFQKWDGFLSVSHDLSDWSRLEFNYLRTEINDLELAGVVYDLGMLRNDQLNIRYVVQEDPDEVESFVLQYWLHQTGYRGDATHESKQRTLYRSFFTLPSYDDFPVNTVGAGRSDSTGLRSCVTFGDPDWDAVDDGSGLAALFPVLPRDELQRSGGCYLRRQRLWHSQSRRDDLVHSLTCSCGLRRMSPSALAEDWTGFPPGWRKTTR